MKIKHFEEIESWQAARLLTRSVYKITKKEKIKKDFSLIDQIRRASVSIMANIAEGFDSRSDKSFINFLSYSNRSTTETQSLLYVAFDQEYISEQEFINLYEQCNKIHGLTGGLIRYLKSK